MELFFRFELEERVFSSDEFKGMLYWRNVVTLVLFRALVIAVDTKQLLIVRAVQLNEIVMFFAF